MAVPVRSPRRLPARSARPRTADVGGPPARSRVAGQLASATTSSGDAHVRRHPGRPASRRPPAGRCGRRLVRGRHDHGPVGTATTCWTTVGAPERAADHPGVQGLAPGDVIPMNPAGDSRDSRCDSVDPPRSMIWGTPGDTSWLWQLEPGPDGTTRLITRIRSRARCSPMSIAFARTHGGRGLLDDPQDAAQPRDAPSALPSERQLLARSTRADDGDLRQRQRHRPARYPSGLCQAGRTPRRRRCRSTATPAPGAVPRRRAARSPVSAARLPPEARAGAPDTPGRRTMRPSAAHADPARSPP